MASLTNELNQIRQFNLFGCVEYTTHATEKLQERGFSKEEIRKTIRRNDTYIIQYHEPYTYHRNPSEVFVLYGKSFRNKKRIPIHIVIAKNINKSGGVHYAVVTTYEPSPLIFKAHGRIMRERKQ